MADTVFRQPDALEALVLKMGAVHNIIWIDGDTICATTDLDGKKNPRRKTKTDRDYEMLRGGKK